MTHHVHRCAECGADVDNLNDGLYHPTARDLELIELVSQGLQNPQIGWKLKCPTQTIKNQLGVIYRAVGVQNRAALVRRAIELGVLTIERTDCSDAG